MHTAIHLRAALKSSASFALLAALPLFASPAFANPLNAAVTTGSASIASSSNKTQIDQKSEGVVIDWSSFNVGAGQTTQFVQPNAQAIAVNRIGGNSASQILGTLDANGRIVLINGNGMLFGKSAQVNVGALIATSTGGSDSDVLSGKFTQGGNQSATVVNQGSIRTAQGGLVALVAPNVSNAGTVNAKFGTVAVGAANKFTVDFSGDGLVSFAAQGDVNSRATATNTGSLVGANVSLTAHAAEGVATGVVTMSGIVTAQTAKNVGGTILLDAGNGSLAMTGTLNAAGQTGGGNIETSGHQVAISGTVTAGKNGNWKVDPENLTIDSAAATTIDNALNSGTSVTEQTTSGAASGSGTQSPGAGDIIVASALSWNTAATLTLNSYHSIDIDAPITIQGGGGLVFVTNNGGTGGDYIFGNGAAITYPGGPGLGASFSLNGTPYTLLYSMSDVQNIDGNRSGDYALADPLDATSVTDWVPIGTSGNAFTGVFAGLGNTISNLTIKDGAGLFGYAGAGAVIRNFGLLNASVTGHHDVGGLVGYNAGAITNDYVTGLVDMLVDSGGPIVAVGGLVGYNDGTIAESYSTATVNGAASHAPNILSVGGLVGYNQDIVSASYASGTVGATDNSKSSFAGVGGLVGYNTGAIADDYSAGLVVGTLEDAASVPGGFVGFSSGTVSGSYSIAEVYGQGSGFGSGSFTDSYWDTQTSAQAISHGGTGLSTAQLLSSLPAGFDPAVWGTGPQLLPYFLWQYPNGTPQAVSGIAFKDSGETTLTPSRDARPYVSALVDGDSIGLAATYANGFYYFLLPPGTISGTGSAVLVYTTANSTSGAANAATLTDATGSLDSFDIWGNTLIAPTAATTYSVASATPLQTQDAALISAATGSNTAAQSLVAGLSDYGYIATGSGFTIDEPLDLSTGLFVETTANDANITLAYPLTYSGNQMLRLDATGNIAIDAAITSAGSVSLAAEGTITFAAAVSAKNEVTLDSAESIDIDRKITSKDGEVTLISGGTIAESGSGSISAVILTGSSVGGTTLNGGNTLNVLEAFTNSGSGGIALTNSGPLTVEGDAVNSGAGNLSLTTSAGNLNIDQSLASGGAITLTAASGLYINGPVSAAGALTLHSGIMTIAGSLTTPGTLLISGTDISESKSGVIVAGTLTGGSTGDAILSGANQIGTLSDFTDGGSELRLTDDSDLTIAGTIQAAGSVSLVDTGTMAETTGAIDAVSLKGSSVGGATFNGANLIGALGTFTNTGSGGLALTDGMTLSVGGPVYVATGDLALTTTGVHSNLKINRAITAGGTVALNSSGRLAQSSTGVITAGELTGGAAAGTTLNGANQIASLGDFTNTGGNFALTDGQTLTISGTVNTGRHSQTIQVTTGDLDLTGALDGKTVTLGSSTGEVFGAGTITANLLNVTANTGIDLTGDNDIGTIGTNQTNSGPDFINNP